MTNEKYKIIIKSINVNASIGKIVNDLQQKLKISVRDGEKLINKVPVIFEEGLEKKDAVKTLNDLADCGLIAEILMDNEISETGKGGLPDIYTIETNYISNFDKLIKLKKTYLNWDELFPKDLKIEHVSPNSCFFSSILLLSIPVIVYYFLPKIGFDPGWLIKLLMLIVLLVIFISLISKFEEKSKIHISVAYAKEADQFIHEALKTVENNEVGIASLRVLIQRNKKDQFFKILLPAINRYIKEHKLNIGKLNLISEQIIESCKNLAKEKTDMDILRNELQKKEYSIRLKNKELHRQELRSKAFGGNYKYNEEIISKEIDFISKDMSEFCNIDSDDLYMAVSPEYLFIFLCNRSFNFNDPSGRSTLKRIFQNSIYYSCLYIIPPSFIRHSSDGFFSKESATKGNFDVVFKKDLDIIRHASSQRRRGRFIEVKEWSYFMGNINVIMKYHHKIQLGPILDRLSYKIGDHPQCPICIGLSNIKPDSIGYTCDTCKIHYRWGRDYLCRITIIPVMDNDPDSYKERWQVGD